MKLILYSGNIPPSSSVDIFHSIPKKNSRLLLIPSDSNNPKSDMYICAYQKQFLELGIETVDVYKFDQFDTYQSGIFDTYDAIFLSGGDTALFWQNLVQTRTHEAIKNFVQRGGLLLGLSAGSMIMMSHIIPEASIPAGLGFIPGYFSPHYHESSLSELLHISAEKYADTIYGVPDESYLVVDHERSFFRGSYVSIKHGLFTLYQGLGMHPL